MPLSTTARITFLDPCFSFWNGDFTSGFGLSSGSCAKRSFSCAPVGMGVSRALMTQMRKSGVPRCVLRKPDVVR